MVGAVDDGPTIGSHEALDSMGSLSADCRSLLTEIKLLVYY